MTDTSRTFTSTIKRLPALAFIVVVALVSAAGGYWFAPRSGSAARGASSSPAAVATADRKPLYWYDPMEPNQHFDEPGKSPFMDMQLVPKYADAGGAEAGVQINPDIVQNLGLRIVSVERAVIAQPIDAVGNIDFNQRDVAILQSRTSGFVTRVYGRAPGDVIRRGAPIVDLLVPEWAAAQAEFATLAKSGDRDLMEAARQRLLLLGMPAELITQIETGRQQQPTITLAAPISGAIETLDIRAGMTVSAGASIAKINGLGSVWLEAAIPEAQIGRVAIGQAVAAHLTAYPGETFNGRVLAILPQSNLETRATRVRVELANPHTRLRPGMFAQMRLDTGDGQPSLWLPSEAIIRTGTRNVVIVAAGPGRFVPTEVQIGAEGGGKTVILAGLEAGQRIVASGQFLIDSEASLQGVLARLSSQQ